MSGYPVIVHMRAGGMQLVESVPLLTNSKANDFVGVNLYVDDIGSIKQLPVNVRASDICRCCGHHIQVHGDAWMARFFDNEDDFKRLDFQLSEVSSGAPWVRTAKAQRDANAQAAPPAEAMRQLQSAADARRAPAQSSQPAAAPKQLEAPPPSEAARVRHTTSQLLTVCIVIRGIGPLQSIPHTWAGATRLSAPHVSRVHNP
jgi:hypothetical protein